MSHRDRTPRERLRWTLRWSLVGFLGVYIALFLAPVVLTIVGTEDPPYFTGVLWSVTAIMFAITMGLVAMGRQDARDRDAAE